MANPQPNAERVSNQSINAFQDSTFYQLKTERHVRISPRQIMLIKRCALEQLAVCSEENLDDYLS